MLPYANITNIIDSLKSAGYLNSTSNVLSWISLFHNQSAIFLQDIVDKTSISIEDLTTFTTEVIPCITSLFFNDTLSEAEITNLINKDCLSYVTTTYECDHYNADAEVRVSMLLYAVIFTAIFSCFCRQRKKFHVNRCNGYPGPVVPLNMLDSYENRIGIALSFGLTVASCVGILFGEYKSIVGTKIAEEIATYPKYLSTFIKILFAVFVSMLTYPFFVCQHMQNKLNGAIMGLIYCITWISLEIQKIIAVVGTCWKVYNQLHLSIGWIALLMDLPKYICLILLMMKFSWVIIKVVKLRQKRKRRGEVISWFYCDDTDWRKEYMYIHVKELMNATGKNIKSQESDDEDNKDEEEDLNLREKIKRTAKKNLYTYKPGFKYSTRIIAAAIVSILAVYTVFLSMVDVGYTFFVSWWDIIFGHDVVAEISKLTGYPIDEIEKYGVCVLVSYWLACAFGFVFFLIIMMNCLTWYRRHILMLRKGDRMFLPSSIAKKSLTPGNLIAASLKYAGYQVGYSAWGYLITFLIAFVAFVVISTQIFLPMFTHRMSLVLTLLIRLWPTIIIAIVFPLLQNIMASRCFLIDQDVLAVDNRKAFHIVSYFMFYFNIFLGLVSCFIRIIFSMLLGIIFLQRLQKSALPRSFERRDPGYLAYLGYILLEHQHANPILQCFVRLLLETQNKKLDDEFYNPASKNKVNLQMTDSVVHIAMEEKTEDEPITKKRVINRWHLFLMLAQNPSLLKFRKSSIKKKHIKKGLLSLAKFGLDVPEDEIKNNTDESDLDAGVEDSEDKRDRNYSSCGDAYEEKEDKKDNFNVSCLEGDAKRNDNKSNEKSNKESNEMQNGVQYNEIQNGDVQLSNIPGEVSNDAQCEMYFGEDDLSTTPSNGDYYSPYYDVKFPDTNPDVDAHSYVTFL